MSGMPFCRRRRTVTLFGATVSVEYDWFPGEPAVTWRLPEDCRPGEPDDLDLLSVTVLDAGPDAGDPEVPAPGSRAFDDALTDLLLRFEREAR